MKILNEINDKSNFYKIGKIIENNVHKKILLAYRKAQREEGSMINPHIFKGNYYTIPMQYSKSRIEISNIITEAIKEEFDILIFYRPDLNWEDAKNIEKLETGIEVILSSVK
jgi:hypothetical protein